MGMFVKYGLEWDDQIHPVMLELTCWKKWRQPPYNKAQLLPPEEHFFNATRLLFTPTQFTEDPWAKKLVWAWSHYDTIVAWGAASCGKSHTTGLLALLDYLTDINNTVSIMASTSKPMLALRSFASVKQYFQILKRNPTFTLPVREAKSAMAICNDTDDSLDDEALSSKAGVRGVAVADGTEESSRQRLQGAHMGGGENGAGGYVRLIGDESEALRDSFFAVRTNLSIGATDFKFVLLCNPESFTSKTASFAEPVGGWGSVSIDDTHWETKVGGVCLHFDGFKSPAIIEPDGERRYPYLITQKQIDRVLMEAHGNADDPSICQMCRGWPPPTGVERALITEQEVQAFGARDVVVWANEGETIRLAALDPAFTSDGDSCVLQSGTLGRDVTGRAVVALDPPHYVPIMASSPRPVTYQIADYTHKMLNELGIPIENLAVDDSGTQSVCDVLDVEIGRGCLRYNYGMKPSDKPLSVVNSTPASERCRNLITELYMISAEFVRARQLRGLGDKAAKHWTARRFKHGVSAGRALETKADFKKRTGLRSPDEGDAAAMLCALARDRFGFLPGGAPAAIVNAATPHAFFSRPSLVRTKYLATNTLGRLSSYLKPK